MPANKEFKFALSCNCGLTFAICALALAGWAFDIGALRSVRADWTPMRIPTAFGLMGCATALLASRDESSRSGRAVCRGFGGVIGLIGLISLLAYFWPVLPDVEAWRMAPITAGIFVGFGGAFFSVASPGRRGAAIGHLIAAPLNVVSFLILVSYLFDAKSITTLMQVPVAFNTGVACCALSVGLLLARPDTWLMRVVVSPGAGGRAARRMLPAVVIVQLLIGWLHFEGEKVGLLSEPVGAAADVTADILAMLIVLWLAARSANRADERYRNLVEMSPEALFVYREGRIIQVNKTALHLLGAHRPEQLIGKTPFDFFHPDYHGIIRERHAMLLSGKAVPLIEEKIVRLDGAIRDVEVAASPLEERQGLAAQVILRDITEKRRERDRLLQLNRTLLAHSRSDQALVHATNEAAYLGEVCRIIVEDCGHAMVWVGLREDDEARTVRPVAYSGFEEGYLDTLGITWADTERGRGPTGSAIRTGETCVCRNMLTDPAFLPWRGQALKRGYASSIVLPLMNGGRAFGALSIYSREPDPFPEAEQKLLAEIAADLAYGLTVLRLREVHSKAERSLRESEERFRTLADSIPHSVWVTTPGGALEYVNARFRAFRGLGDGDIVDWRVWRDGVHPNDLAECESAWSRLATSGESVTFEYRLQRARDGVWRWQLGHGQAIRAADGSLSLLIGTSTDVHDQKLAEEVLRQSQKLESIGVLAGGIAHDFNNLLVGVVGNASLAEEMLPPESPVIELLRRIVESGEHAAHLTRQMLAYAGQGRFIVEPVDLSAQVRRAAALIQSSISKKITLKLRLAPKLPGVESDSSQMQQVLMNLATNAAEAIGSGSGVVTIATGETELNGGRGVFLEVRDTGSGMDAATKARIFDPFFTTKFQGRGLGLAAVAGIVRAHKGIIDVVTAPGAGSSFRVVFPATAAAAVEPAAPVPGHEDLRGHGTVLVVDDEEIVRDTARHSLERHGYEVLVAENGPAAIDIVRREGPRIGLVLLDLSMPGMSGEETLPHLRSIRPELEVIVSSGYSETEALRLFRGARVSAFLQKPYTVQELARKAIAVLSQGRGLTIG